MNYEPALKSWPFLLYNGYQGRRWWICVEDMIYISGPMSGYPENNYPAFFEAERDLILKGWNVLNPASLPLMPGREREYYLRHDLAAMATQCTHMVLLPAWGPSWGANLEYYVATQLAITVYHGLDNVPIYTQRHARVH